MYLLQLIPIIPPGERQRSFIVHTMIFLTPNNLTIKSKQESKSIKYDIDRHLLFVCVPAKKMKEQVNLNGL